MQHARTAANVSTHSSVRTAAAATVALVLSAAASAQVNPFVFYPQDPERQTVTCTSFVGRPDVSNRAEALMELNIDHFRGVGDDNHSMRLFGIYHWVADEKLSTIETYDLIIRRADPVAGPDMSPTAEITRIAGLTTPPSSNQNRGTWIMYDGFNMQGGVIAGSVWPTQTDRVYVGIDLPANPLWPATDGHSLFRADLLNANTGATLGENHAPGVPDPTWAGIVNGSFSTKWTYILGPFVTTPNLHMGGVDPTSNRLGAPGANLSMNGLFPDVSGNPRSDGLIVRVTDNLAPFGLVFLGAQFGFLPPNYAWQFQGALIGNSHISGPSALPILSLDVASLQNGQYEYTVAVPNTIPTFMLGEHLVFQAIVWDTNTGIGNWTNAQATYF